MSRQFKPVIKTTIQKLKLLVAVGWWLNPDTKTTRYH